MDNIIFGEMFRNEKQSNVSPSSILQAPQRPLSLVVWMHPSPLLPPGTPLSPHSAFSHFFSTFTQ